jgi:hypothetical protein
VFKRTLGTFVGSVATAMAFVSPCHAQSADPLASQSFQIGTAGAQCEAQGVRLGDARDTVYDRKWALICSDVERPIGAAYSWRAASDIDRRVGLSRGTKLDCGVAGGTVDAVPGVTFRRCRDPETGLD